MSISRNPLKNSSLSLNRNLRLSLLAASLLLPACGSYQALGGSSTQTRTAKWSENSHGKSASPNYAVVFPEGEVKRLEIEISPADWALMQANMQELYGEGGGLGGPGGAGGPGGLAPGVRPSGVPGGMPDFPAGWTPGDPMLSSFPSPPAGFQPGYGGGENPIWRPAKITFQGQTWEHVGIRYKGNSSLRSSWGNTEKMPFRFNFDYFEDEFPQIDDQRFFGFKKLSLSSGFTDNSLIREKVAADIFRAAGVPAARTAFYRVYVDHGQGSQYFGLYTLVEIPDPPMLESQFGNRNGNLYKPSGSGARFVTFNADSFARQSNEDSTDWSDIQAVFSALHADRNNAASWRQGLERVLNVPGFLRYLAVNTLIQNWDTYGRMEHNYYLYHNPADGKIHWIPWDHNMSLSASMGGGMRPGGQAGKLQPPAGMTWPEGFEPPQRPGGMGGGPGGGALSLELSAEEVGDNWPLIRYLMDDPVYRAQYVTEVEKALNGAFAKENTRQRFQSAHSLIRPYVTGAEGERPEATLLSSPEAFEPALDELLTHLENRHEAAASFLAGAR